MSTRRVLDVSGLPHHSFDKDSVWWGNWGLLAIETTMFAIAIATYFYVRQNFQLWPPPLTDTQPPELRPLPYLTIATINMLLLVISCVPMILTDMAARRGDSKTVHIALIVCLVFGALSITLRAFEFSAVRFRWDSNAYGSIVWFILGMHLAHLITVTLEAFLLTLWTPMRKFDMKHRVDITVVAIYWYWVAAIWILLYAIIYLSPRFSY